MNKLIIVIFVAFVIFSVNGFATCTYIGGDWQIDVADDCLIESQTLNIDGDVSVYGNLTLINMNMIFVPNHSYGITVSPGAIFEMRDSDLSNSKELLVGTNNIKIINNTFQNNTISMKILNSYNHWIENNSFTNTIPKKHEPEIHLRNVNNSYFINNTVQDFYHGLKTENSNYNHIEGNKFFMTSKMGYYSYNYGIIIIEKSTNNTLKNNEIFNIPIKPSSGIYISNSDDNILDGNNIHDIKYNGITVKLSNNNVINNTNISFVYMAIELGIDSNRNHFDNININSSGHGIFMTSSNDYNIIENSNIHNTSDSSLQMYGSKNNIINNTNMSSDKVVIMVLNHPSSGSSDNNYLGNINIDSGEYGIVVVSSNNETIENINTNSTQNGLALLSSDNNLIKNVNIYNSYDTIFGDLYCSLSQNSTFYDISINGIKASFEGTGFTIKHIQSPPTDNNGIRNIGSYLNITSVTSDSWIYLNLTYDNSMTLNEGTVSLYHYDGTWNKLSSTLDIVNDYVHMNITSFSLFGLFEKIIPEQGPVYNSQSSSDIIGDSGFPPVSEPEKNTIENETEEITEQPKDETIEELSTGLTGLFFGVTDNTVAGMIFVGFIFVYGLYHYFKKRR